LVTLLHDLKGSSIASEKATEAELKTNGLLPPAKKVTVLGAGDRVIAELYIGSEASGKVPVRSADIPRVFLVETSRLSQLPANAEDLAETPPPGDGGVGSASAASSTPGKK
jgi:hypothetical protein